MGWIDLIIVIVLALNVVSGIKNGFFEEVGTFAGLIVGILAGIALKEEVAQFLLNHTSTSVAWVNISGFLIPFLLVFLFFVIMAKVFSHFFKAISMGWLNRTAGGVFCLFKGVLILSVMLNLYEMVDKDRSLIGPERAERSILYEPVLKVAPKLFPTLKNMFYKKDHDNESEGSRTINV